MNLVKARETIIDFIRTKIREANVNGVVVGLSGGIDSALTAYLAVEALGHENVLGIHLPELDVTPDEDVLDATEVAGRLNIDFKIIDISGIMSSFMSSIPESDTVNVNINVNVSPLTNGNLKARIRMSVLYYYANLSDRMVIGTGNKTEMILGYYTKYGDGGVDIEPIGDLYKTEVIELSRMAGVPERIITKPPTAGLWIGQTDEEELGMSYVMLDKLFGMLLSDEDPEFINDILNISLEQIDSIIRRINVNIHKSQTPPIAFLDDAHMG
ncbi:MAG TPA: NAD+ synthase [Methanosarcinaceae archaeon]|nr:NAD+ synthase [Methanosarcinaceae archaeon]